MVIARFWRKPCTARLIPRRSTCCVNGQRHWVPYSGAGSSSSSRQYHCVSLSATQTRRVGFRFADRRHLMSSYGSVDLAESSVRQVISSAVKCALTVPQHAWSAEYVVESVLSELTVPSTSIHKSSGSDDTSNSGSGDHHDAAVNVMQPAQPVNSSGKGSRASASAAEPAGDASTPGSSSSVRLLPEVAALFEDFTAAAAAVGDAPLTGEGDGVATARSDRRSRKQSSVSSRRSSADSGGSTTAQVEQLQEMFSQLLYEEYHQVEQEDVVAFSSKLLSELSVLVQTAQQAADEEEQGLCGLCGRDMPLTKHHLIPRDVHKEFKKRGYSPEQLQSGLMVCRPCHSAIHRAVPDNKQLAMHYDTAEALSQHEEVAKFAAWAGRQRVTSKGDANSKHFKYRR